MFVFFTAFSVVFFLGLVGTGWLFISSPLFQIKKIDITGNNLVAHADVISLLHAKIFSGAWWKLLLGAENILVWPDTLVNANDMVFYPAIKTVSISKNYFRRTVSVKVHEREPIGVWCYQGTRTDVDIVRTNVDYTQNNADNNTQTISPKTQSPIGFSDSSASVPRLSASCWWFDDGGVAFKRSPSTEGKLIMTVQDYSQKGGLNSKILPDRFIGNFLSVIRVIQKSSVDEKEILVKDIAREEVEVLTHNGPKLYFSLRFPADSALTAIEHLQGKPSFKNLRYIDFRVENKVYYK